MSVEEENPQPRRNPGMMGGGAASEEGEFALDAVNSEASNMSANANASGMGYDEGSQVNTQPPPREEDPPAQEGSGGDYEEQQETIVEAEAVDDDTDEGDITYTGPVRPDPIGAQDIVGAPPETPDDFIGGIPTGIVATPVTPEVAQMGYDTPEVILPTAPPELPPFPNEVTINVEQKDKDGNIIEVPITYNLTDEGGYEFNWETNLDPEADNIIQELNVIRNQINEINDPANNGFVKVTLDEPILIPEVLDADGNVIREAYYQDFTWIHESVQDANRDLEQHQLTNPTSSDNLPEGWTIVDMINKETGEKIQATWDHDENPDTPDVFRWADEDETIPIWQQTLQPPQVDLTRLENEISELTNAEQIYVQTVDTFKTEVQSLEKLEKEVKFWNDNFINNDGRFTGNQEQYEQYKNSIDTYQEKFNDVQDLQSTILAGYAPRIPELDKDGNPKLDADGNLVTIPDLDNSLRGKIFEEVAVGEGKYIKDENDNFIKSDEGTFNIKTGAGGLPLENLWSNYLQQFDDVDIINRDFSTISGELATLASAWSSKFATLSDAQQTQVFTHHGLDSKGQKANENSTWDLIANNQLDTVQDPLRIQADLLERFGDLKGSLMSGNEQLAAQLGIWNQAASKQYQDAIVWETLQKIEDAKRHRAMVAPIEFKAETMPGSYGDVVKAESFWLKQEYKDPETGEIIDASRWDTPSFYEPTKEIMGDFYHGDTDLQGRPINQPITLTEDNWSNLFRSNDKYKYELVDNIVVETNIDPTDEELLKVEAGDLSLTTELRNIGEDVIIKPPQASGVTWKYAGNNYATSIPMWAVDPETGEILPGYRPGLGPEQYEKERLAVAMGDFSGLSNKEAQAEVAIVQTGVPLLREDGSPDLQLAVDYFGANSLILDKIFDDGEEGSRYKHYDGGVDPDNVKERILYYENEDSKGQTGFWDNEEQRFIPKYFTEKRELWGVDALSPDKRTINPEWKKLDRGRRLYLGNKTTVQQIWLMQNKDGPQIQQLLVAGQAGATATTESVIRRNPEWTGARSLMQGTLPVRWGEGNILDAFEAGVGAGVGQKVTIFGMDVADPAEMGFLFRPGLPDAPESRKISMMEMSGANYFQGRTLGERQALVAAYMAGSTGAEVAQDWAIMTALTAGGTAIAPLVGTGIGAGAGIGVVVGKKAIRLFLNARASRPGGMIGRTGGRIGGGFKSIVAPPIKRVAATVPQPISTLGKRVALTAATVPKRAAFVGKEFGISLATQPGRYLPVGSAWRFFTSAEGVYLTSGKAIAKGITAVPNRVFGTNWLTDIHIMPALSDFKIGKGYQPAMRDQNIFDLAINLFRPGTRMDPRVTRKTMKQAEYDNWIKKEFGDKFDSSSNRPVGPKGEPVLRETIDGDNLSVIYRKPDLDIKGKKQDLDITELNEQKIFQDNLDELSRQYRRGHGPFAIHDEWGNIYRKADTKIEGRDIRREETYGDFIGTTDSDPLFRWLFRRADTLDPRARAPLEKGFADMWITKQTKPPKPTEGFMGGFLRGFYGRTDRKIYEELLEQRKKTPKGGKGADDVGPEDSRGPDGRDGYRDPSEGGFGGRARAGTGGPQETGRQTQPVGDAASGGYKPPKSGNTTARTKRAIEADLRKFKESRNTVEQQKFFYALRERQWGKMPGNKFKEDPFKKGRGDFTQEGPTVDFDDIRYHADDLQGRKDIREINLKVDATQDLLLGTRKKKRFGNQFLLDDARGKKLLDDFGGQKLLDDLGKRLDIKRLIDDGKGKPHRLTDGRGRPPGLDEPPKRPELPEGRIKKKRLLEPPGKRKLLPDDTPTGRKKLPFDDTKRLEPPEGRYRLPWDDAPTSRLPWDNLDDIKRLDPPEPHRILDDIELRPKDYPRGRPRRIRLPIIPGVPIIPFGFPRLPGGGGIGGGMGLGGFGLIGAILVNPISDLKLFSTSQTQFLPTLEGKTLSDEIQSSTTNVIPDVIPTAPRPSGGLPTETQNSLIQEPVGYRDTSNPTIIPNGRAAAQPIPNGQAYTPRDSLGEITVPKQTAAELPPKPQYAINSGMTTSEAWALAFGRRGDDQLGMQTNAGTDVFPTINSNKASSNSIKNFMTIDTRKQNVNKASLKNVMNGEFF